MSVPTVTLTLGDFTFADSEIPEKISFGGKQVLVPHDLVGGVRVVDAMGRQDAPLEWSGLLRGPSALPRARALNQKRIAGTPMLLTWSELRYWVLIESFQADFERFYQIPYRISCTAVIDYSQPAGAASAASVDSLVNGDMATANTLTTQVGDSTLSGLMGTLNTAISGVSSFAKATQSTINTVLVPLAAVQSQVGTLIASVGNTIQTVTTIGGVLPNNPIAQQTSRLLGQVNAMQRAPSLINLRNVLGRVGINLGAINSGPQTVTVAGGNLYSVAAKEYGDATAWTGIARANNMTDPQVTGVKTLIIPANADGAGGVLNG